jgi:LemA protein
MNFDLKKFMPLILLGVGAILLFMTCGSYNSAITKDEGVKKKWSQVEVQYQARMDVVNQLVATVQGQSDYERGALEAVVQARASATQVKVDPNNLTPESIAKFEQAQNQLGSTLSRLLVVNESYPNLRANEGYLKLQDAVEGNERRIAVARKDFNDAVADFNTHIRRFPANLILGMFGFSAKGYFESQGGAATAPKIEFNNK